MENNIDEIWNGKLYEQLRQEVESKQYNDICNSCNVVSSKQIFLTAKNLIKSSPELIK